MKRILLALCLVALWSMNAYAFMAIGTGAMSASFDKQLTSKKLVSIRLHLSAAGGVDEPFKCTLDSGAGAAYDAVLYSTKSGDMVTSQDVVYVFETPVPFRNYGDKLTFTYTNTNSRTWGLEVIFE